MAKMTKTKSGNVARRSYSSEPELDQWLVDYAYKNRLTKSEVIVLSLKQFQAKNNRKGQGKTDAR